MFFWKKGPWEIVTVVTTRYGHITNTEVSYCLAKASLPVIMSSLWIMQTWSVDRMK